MSIEVGTIIDGKYEVKELIARGSQARIFRATQTNLEREVAIKVLDTTLSKEEARERFRREAKIMAGLAHPGVTHIYDFGLHEETPYLVMELLTGETLGNVLAMNTPTIKQAVQIALEITSALKEVHQKGAVHRDLKPANIFITKKGAKLLDFGVVRALQDPEMTQVGTVFGTPLYMSPDQARGKRVDHRADLYTVGILLYEMTTGSRPFFALDVDTLLLIVQRGVEDETFILPRGRNSEIPESLEDIILKALAPKPGDGFQTAEELEKELEGFQGEWAREERRIKVQEGGEAARRLEEYPPGFQPPGPKTIAWIATAFPKKDYRRPLAIGLITLVVLLLGGFAGILLFGLSSHIPEPVERQQPVISSADTNPEPDAGTKAAQANDQPDSEVASEPTKEVRLDASITVTRPDAEPDAPAKTSKRREGRPWRRKPPPRPWLDKTPQKEPGLWLD